MNEANLTHHERRKLIPAPEGRPVVMIAHTLRLVCGRELKKGERYPLCEVIQNHNGKRGATALVHFRNNPLTSKIYVPPGYWKMS